jgi:hypothetical protein
LRPSGALAALWSALRSVLGAGLLVAAAWFAVPAHAGTLGAAMGFCETPTPLSATQKDRLLRFTALIKDTLEHSGRRVALIARSGTDLRLFDLTYSHAGVALEASANGPWSVRQLYFACEERRPRLFDQGLAGFVFGTDNPRSGFVSILLLPEAAGAALERAALDGRRALALLAGTYSANAHAYALSYQNCNQWVAELLAEAWSTGPSPSGWDAGSVAPDADGPGPEAPRRPAAQTWLRERGYLPHGFEMLWAPMTHLASLLPFLHADDHPREALREGRFEVSMPESLEAFVRRSVPGAERIEFCHQGEHAVRRRGWHPIGRDCVAAAGDEVIALD